MKWTSADDNFLTLVWGTKTVEHIASVLGRSVQAIRQRVRYLRLDPKAEKKG